MDHFDLPGFLASSPLFSALLPEELARMAQGCRIRRLVKGDMVFRVGEPCEAFYLVASGQVKLFLVSAAGQEKVVEIFSAGHSFAEALMFLEKPYILSAQALTDALLIEVSKQGVFSEIESDPRFCRHLLAGISRRLHRLIQDVESYSLQNGLQRLIGYLLRDVELTAAPGINTCTVTLPVSKATVASRLSLTPEYFSRVLHELEDHRLIEIHKRDIHILNIQALTSYGAH
ncbi:Crp/Fnr family transcriptional regulator [Rhodoferax sp.]|uniref:Crp/Fnr family transcriptional regulator n=1 Tax=Rhodoferax sp. TaxID=50421 RepID=UPI002637DA36|nr:Crp/Fnr family transcriptional regulator [Rhodoferax sp.]MDD2924991.1 Crp/Fnr family transcriptional regulator [Rhodoferax sp.]